MRKITDHTGKTFGRWHVESYAGSHKWNCVCECGTKKAIPSSNLTRGLTQSCGCLRKELFSHELSGKRFGKLTAIEKAGQKWLCKCDCGSRTEVTAGHLNAGCVTSCGCTTDGRTRHPLYNTWDSMVARCHDETNTGYPRYGARGISVCDKWRNDFWAFVSDMGEKPSLSHSLDRIDNTLGYSPQNCRWATKQEQANNRGNNHYLTIDGVKKTVAEWERTLGFNRGVLKARLAYRPVEELITEFHFESISYTPCRETS